MCRDRPVFDDMQATLHSMKAPLVTRILTICVLAAALLPVVRAAESEFYYYYRGSRILLETEDSKVAVKLTSQKHGGESPTDLAARNFSGKANGLGYKQDDATSYRPRGWIKMNTKSAEQRVNASPQSTPKEKLRKIIDDLSGVDDVEFVSPVFRDQKGDPIAFESTILIGFFEGTSETAQTGILNRIAKLRSVTRHGPKNKWVVEINSRNGLDLLDAANAIATLPGVRYAEPHFIFTAQLR